MHAAIRSPLAAGVALLGAGAIAATPIAATPPDVHISHLRVTLSAQLVQISPVTAAERLLGQTATDAEAQAARVLTFPIPRAVLLNLGRVLGGGGVATANTALSPFGAAATVGTAALVGTTAPALPGVGGGVLGTVGGVLQDGVLTATRLVPATIDAVTGVILSTINAPIQIGLTTFQVVLNVGAAVLSLNPVTVLNAAALGAIRIASVVEQTTIGTPALAFGAPQPFNAPQPATVARVRATPSILSSILNGRDEIANAISPLAARLAPGAVPSTAALTTATAQVQKSTLTPLAKKTAKKTARKASSAPTTTPTGPKHARHEKHAR